MAAALSRPNREYQDENGTYQLPKDSQEQERLDRQSASIIALMDGKPFHAPISQPKRILDIGCGTGSMINMLASMYPDAEVIGVDIAPVPGSRHDGHPNVSYIQGDIRELIGKDPRLTSGSFDYVFQRLLVFGMTEWDQYISTIASLVRSEGWLEIQEASAQLYSEEGNRRFDGEGWYNEFVSHAVALGLNIEVGDSLKQLMEATPLLVNVRETVYNIPVVGPEQAPELQGLEKHVLLGMFSTVMMKMANARHQEEAYTEQLLKEMKLRWEKGFEGSERWRMYVVVGQRI